MVATCGYPLDSSHLFEFREEASVQRLAAAIVSLASMHRVVIDKCHVFLESMVHEGDSVSSEAVVCGQAFRLFLEPLDLISSHAIVPA